MDEHEGKTLIAESSVGRLYMYWEEWKSNRFLHLRYWYQDKNDKQWKPGKKGIAVPEANLPKVLMGLRILLGFGGNEQ